MIRRARRWPTLGAPATIALSLALFAVVFTLREIDSNSGNGEGALYLIPMTILALRFGLRGGLAGAASTIALLVTWDLLRHPATVTFGGYLLTRSVAFAAVGVGLGLFVQERRRLGEQLSRFYEVSLDLLVTVDRSGRFIRVSPSWERALGHSAEAMCSMRARELVHPDDRASTDAATASLIAGSRQAVAFRNRFRTVDGDYRWLQWSASGSPSDGLIYGIARDITAQVEAEALLADNATLLESKVHERTLELEESRAETLHTLAIAAEYHDDETAQHTNRVGVIAGEIAVSLGLDANQITLIQEAAPLHDVGKLGVSDTILLKRGRLTSSERAIMKTHAALGARVLSGSHAPVLAMAAVIAASHHEHWDGMGYPLGLAGEAIPLVGRIVAVADVFDALTHERPYKREWSIPESLAEIERSSGGQFDPRVVDAFLRTRRQTIGSPPAIGAPQTGRAPQTSISARSVIGSSRPPARRERGVALTRNRHL